MPDAGVEIKTPTKHVEAAIRVISGRGFDSPRLQLERLNSRQAALNSAFLYLTSGRVFIPVRDMQTLIPFLSFARQTAACARLCG